MLLATTQDVLFIVLAFCALWLTLFLSWLLYYWIGISRDVERLLRQGQRAIEAIDHVAHVVQDKVENSATSLMLVAQAAKELVVWAIQERGKKSKKK